MSSLLKRLFGRARKGSGITAKNRLRFVLQHDRINLPPQRMEEMKREILAVIAKYLVVDKERVEIALEQRDRMHSKLVAEIPFAKDQSSPIQPEASASKTDADDTSGGNGSGASGTDSDADKEKADADAETPDDAAKGSAKRA